MTISDRIKPLFNLAEHPDNMNHELIIFSGDNYNKESGTTLIDAKHDGQAISTFLREYKDSPKTLRSYAKEIERLLLWCIHVAKINISSLRRDHLLNYQEFLNNPQRLYYLFSIGDKPNLMLKRVSFNATANKALEGQNSGIGQSYPSECAEEISGFLFHKPTNSVEVSSSRNKAQTFIRSKTALMR